MKTILRMVGLCLNLFISGSDQVVVDLISQALVKATETSCTPERQMYVQKLTLGLLITASKYCPSDNLSDFERLLLLNHCAARCGHYEGNAMHEGIFHMFCVAYKCKRKKQVTFRRDCYSSIYKDFMNKVVNKLASVESDFLKKQVSEPVQVYFLNDLCKISDLVTSQDRFILKQLILKLPREKSLKKLQFVMFKPYFGSKNDTYAKFADLSLLLKD
jgi:hypothetical protein